MPGITSLSDKRRLIETLTSAYGDGAFSILPRTFLLPELYWDWRVWIHDQVRHFLVYCLVTLSLKATKYRVACVGARRTIAC